MSNNIYGFTWNFIDIASSDRAVNDVWHGDSFAISVAKLYYMRRNKMEKKIGVVGKVIGKLGFIFGDGAKCQLGFYEPKKPRILMETKNTKK